MYLTYLQKETTECSNMPLFRLIIYIKWKKNHLLFKKEEEMFKAFKAL